MTNDRHTGTEPHRLPTRRNQAETLYAMSEFVTVAKVGAIAEGQGGTFSVGGRLVAVFNRGGVYHAIDDLCPHMGASLGAGHMDEQGIVTCPWHAWHFAVCDGTWCDNPRIKIDAFDVRVAGDDIQVATEPRAAGR